MGVVEFKEADIRDIESDLSLIILGNAHFEYYRNSNTAMLGHVPFTSYMHGRVN